MMIIIIIIILGSWFQRPIDNAIRKGYQDCALPNEINSSAPISSHGLLRDQPFFPNVLESFIMHIALNNLQNFRLT